MSVDNKANRVVVITGASSGIGKAMAQAFARNGDRVTIIGRREEPLCEVARALGVNCDWQRADVTDRKDVASAVNDIVGKFGKIDVLINNAGYSRGITPDLSFDRASEIWDEELQVNLTSAFLMSLAVAPHLTRPGGRIINISSDAALTGAVGLRLAGYAAAKAGMFGLTRALALEYGPQGITVNCIAPGFIEDTGSTARVPADIVKSIASQLPVRRAGNANDIAGAALYLASADSGFITGEILNVNGGRIFGR